VLVEKAEEEEEDKEDEVMFCAYIQGEDHRVYHIHTKNETKESPILSRSKR